LVIREDGRVRIGPGDLNIYTDTIMRLDVAGNTQINGRLYVAGSDFELGYNDGRNKGSRPRCRALAHTDDGIGGDNLIINVGGDFEGGVHVQGPKLVIEGNTMVGQNNPADPPTVAKFQVRQSSNTEWAGEFRNGGGSGKGLLVRAATSGSSAALFETQLWDGTSRFKVRADGKIYVNNDKPLFYFFTFWFSGSTTQWGDVTYSAPAGINSTDYNAIIAGFAGIRVLSDSTKIHIELNASQVKIFHNGYNSGSFANVLFIHKSISEGNF
jgi:hypothetical protein